MAVALCCPYTRRLQCSTNNGVNPLLHQASQAHDMLCKDVRAAIRLSQQYQDIREAYQTLYANYDKLFPLCDSKTAYQLVEIVCQQIVFPVDNVKRHEVFGGLFMGIVRNMLADKDLGLFFTLPSVVASLFPIYKMGREIRAWFTTSSEPGGFLLVAGGYEPDAQVDLLAPQRGARRNILCAPPKISSGTALTRLLPTRC